MSQTRMVAGTQPDTDVVMKESAAAAMLVDVAAGLVQNTKASDSSSSSAGRLANQKLWDREAAAPPTDHGIARRMSTNDDGTIAANTGDTSTTTTVATPQANTNNTNTPASNSTAANTPQYQPPPAPSNTPYHTPGPEHHVAAAPNGAPPTYSQPPPPPHHAQPLNHSQVAAAAARRPPPAQPARPPPQEPGRWPAAQPPPPPPPPGYPPHHHPAHMHHHAAAAHAHHVAAAAAAHAHHAAAAAAHSRQMAQQQPASAVLMSMSSIGFGVAPASSTDATEAVIRAVQDSMERSAVRLPTVASLRQSLTIHLKLGVPPKPTGEPMHVDVSRLSLFLPQSVPLLPVEVVVGGLLIDHKEIEESTMKPSGGAAPASQQPTICTAVACVTLQQSAPETIEQTNRAAAEAAGMPPSVRPPHNAAAPWPDHQQAPPPLHGAPPPPPPPPMAPQQAQLPGRMPPLTAGTNNPPVHRTNSMEVLAQVSGEIRDRQIKGTHEIPHAAAALAMVCSNEVSYEAMEGYPQHRNSFGSRGSMSVDSNSAYSYKKLAPGVTPKGSKRLFVRHNYKDYSREQPLPEELFLVRSDTKTPNAAFPLKLHETLSQIELDGYGHIIGWMPHGRSFKIFQQQDFVDVILPRYFVMTKKSSFLRQLNLYNFNRISVGPDSGSYYHEKFLKGLKFLCRRMSRQKVNGNGIRAAGNPDDEPTLANYPKCPPQPGGENSSDSSSANEEEQEADQKESSGERPYSRLVGNPATRPYGQATRASAPTQQANGPEATVVTDEGTLDSSGSTKRPSTRLSRTDSSSQASFPLKLQRILDKADADGRTDIISWLPHGKAFLVHDVDRFVSEVMSQHFNQTKYSSFQRQLHMYNFQRITFGRDKGAYHHDKFQRGRPDLCMTMVRTRVNGKGCRRPGDPDNEPDFYVDWEAGEGSPGGNESQSEKDGDAVPAGEPV